MSEEFRKLDVPYYCESGVKAGRRQGCACIPDPKPCDECAEFATKLRPWIDNEKLVPELHSDLWNYDIRVFTRYDNVVEIDPVYAAVSAKPVRVSVEGDEWVIERMVESTTTDPPGTTAWVVCARFPLDGAIR